MDTAATPPRHLSAGRSINDLPTDALLRVLSHVGARQLVQTRELSRMWRTLWRDVPRINALPQEFMAEAGGDYEERNRLFKDFVTRLLTLRNENDAPLVKFSLESFRVDAADADLLIRHALLRKVKSVDVLMFGHKELDPDAFTSQHLTSLRLGFCMLDYGFFEHLQAGCNALECLKLEGCVIGDTRISSQTLKILSMDCCGLFRSDHPASISIPGLMCFAFSDHAGHRLPSIENMNSLATAYVTVGGAGAQVDDISQFLLGLSSVTKLEFNLVVTELKMEDNLWWCTKFNNLKFLTLGEWCLDADFCPLIAFLQNSPNLENLTVNLKEHADKPGTLCGKLQERSFTCGQLKIVEIVCLERDSTVDRLEKFLVANGMTSSQIEIKEQ